jgi:hypothetical protein
MSVWILPLEAPRDRRHVVARLLERHAAAEPTHGAEETASAVRIDPQRLEVFLGIAIERKTRWHHPDDRVRTFVDSNRLADG